VNPVDDLSCQELVELITDYLEGALAPETRARVELHLGGCDGCASYLDQMRDTIRIVGALREEDLDPRLRDELVGAFRGWHR
jgi:anti-sigma factor RsiW